MSRDGGHPGGERFYSVTRRSCFGVGALAELTTGALILVVGAVFTLLGLLVFPFLCIGVPLLVVGLILVVVEGGETRKPPVYGYPAYYPYPTLPTGTPIPPPGQAPAAAPGTPGQPPIPAGAKFCTNCGAALAPGLSFCPNCGARIAT